MQGTGSEKTAPARGKHRSFRYRVLWYFHRIDFWILQPIDIFARTGRLVFTKKQRYEYKQLRAERYYKNKRRFFTLKTNWGREYGNCCMICGRKTPFGSLTIDHIIPVSRGGSDGVENLRLACAKCNKAKGDQLDSEWKGIPPKPVLIKTVNRLPVSVKKPKPKVEVVVKKKWTYVPEPVKPQVKEIVKKPVEEPYYDPEFISHIDQKMQHAFNIQQKRKRKLLRRGEDDQEGG